MGTKVATTMVGPPASPLLLALALCVAQWRQCGASWPWRNSTASGAHTFLAFDSGVPTASINATFLAQHHMAVPDFVWGAGAGHVAAYRRLSGSVVVSKYIPYAWAPDATQTLAWWQSMHPVLVPAPQRRYARAAVASGGWVGG